MAGPSWPTQQMLALRLGPFPTWPTFGHSEFNICLHNVSPVTQTPYLLILARLFPCPREKPQSRHFQFIKPPTCVLHFIFKIKSQRQHTNQSTRSLKCTVLPTPFSSFPAWSVSPALQISGIHSFPKLHTFACRGCHCQAPQAEGLDTRVHFLSALEAGCRPLGRQQGWFLPRPLSLVCRHHLLPGSSCDCPLCMSVLKSPPLL